ncbi:MAG: putative 2-aminoethylphosphonate ABC transporter ATP-binding protein [Rhodospirillales bacterium]|nr:putative 2-aminoethylphosphonate ABC transporter ATP-binding protein [Rhodospirillales bacterium]
MSIATNHNPDGAPYLRIERLTKQFGSFTALKDIGLEIYPGEFVCFLGPSGCGKTTLLRAIAGLDIQTSGRIFQGGKDISALPSSHRDFGIVFQSYALFPNLSVSANVGYGLVSRGLPKVEIETRVNELLHLVGLPDAGRKYPAQLSGGQQQRIALARALALSPGLLLLDEPLSALDARVRSHLRVEIRRLHQRLGVTTIMVTHDQEEALTMADRIVVMNHGVIEQVGTPTEVYRKPASAFVADFVGTTNFLNAVVAGPGHVRLGDINLACELDVHFGPGNDVTLAIRPEDVVVRNIGPATPNTFDARIAEIEFLGSFCRVGLAINGELAGGPPALVADFSINAVRDLAIAEGKVMPVALPPDRLRVFARPPQAP